MTEQQVLDIIRREFGQRAVEIDWRGRMGVALGVAARRIVAEAENEQRAAARTASMVGFSVTRGRTRL